MLADIRYAVRSLWRAPWYLATVISVIALGMALATTVFAVVDGVLFRPLAYPNANRLMAVDAGFNNLPALTSPQTSLVKLRAGNSVSVADVANWQAAAPGITFTGIRVSIQSGMGEGVNEPPAGIGFVQRNFFDTMGVAPMAGGFVASDFDHADSVLPVVITHALWQGRFQGAGDVIGRTFIRDPSTGRGFRIVGVMPRDFVFPSRDMPVGFIAPFVPSAEERRDPTRRVLRVIARLPPGMAVSALQAQVETGMATTTASFPVRARTPGWSDRGWRMQGPFDHADVVPLSQWLGSTSRPLFRVVFLATLVLLTLGGLNVSGLMAARGLDRVRELSLRRALGATGLRLARLVFMEALVPILVASAIGLALATPLLQLGLRLLPDDLVLLTPYTQPTIDGRVVLFVLLSAIALSVPTTIWPIRRALSIGATTMVDGSRGSVRTRSVGRTVVVASQVAGALVLTVGGALLMTSVMAVYAKTPPIRTDGIVVLREAMLGPESGGIGAPDRTARTEALLDVLRHVPGVDGVAVTEGQVLDGGGGVPWWIKPSGAAASRLQVVAHAVTADFYRVLHPQLLMGRFPTETELAGDAPVIVVSESVARAYWPNASPIGQTLNYRGVSAPFAVVGVVKDVRWNAWDAEIATIYGPYGRVARMSYSTVFISTQRSAAQIAAQAMQAITAFDPLIRTTQAGTLNEWFADTVRPRRFQSWLFGSFALGALIIVGVGILGLIAMATASRTKEMGIRLALGATRNHLIGLLLREQLRAVVAGVIIGSLVSAWAVRFLKVYLYQITAYDPRVWAAAVVAIVATAAVGTLIPALRASRVDPVRALNVE